VRQVDLRSDVVTGPTDAMWDAMRQAELGWAMMGEDPSVNELERYAAELSGKESALYIPTGTMANLVALMTHTDRGDQVILEASSHILWSEEWGFAYICGVVPRPIGGTSGYMEPDDVKAAIVEQRFSHRANTSLICLENTHNMAGGTVISPSQVSAIAGIAREHSIPVHLDGARLFNACVALHVELSEMAADVDTLTLNLNKGLSAPEGALLCGPRPFIDQSRVNLKRLGGWTLSKAGIPAAAGLVALKTMIPRLEDDHRRARLLAQGLQGLRRFTVNLGAVQTNIVMVSVDSEFMSARSLLNLLAEHNVRGYLFRPDAIRFVTHRLITDDDIRLVVEIMRDIDSSDSR
jgi:threonine aldolase